MSNDLIRRLNSADADFDQQLESLTRYESTQDDAIGTTVSSIIKRVRNEGDKALLELTAQLDRHQLADAASLQITSDELQAALKRLPSDATDALYAAADRVRQFHQRQLTKSWRYREASGTELGQKVTPLDRVGLYVPGGKAAYPSSVLMNAIPAQVAGVGQIQMVVPTPDGVRNDMVLAAAAIAGVHQVFTIGGAQAVAALAFGTQTIAPVDKIVGPGNAYVAEAKRQVYGTVGIDMIAGPSEILVLTDGSAPAEWVAMDLFSQAEHDEMAQAILLCPDASYIEQVANEIERLLPQMPRAKVIEQSLRDRGALIQVTDMAQACEIANQIAPEHLELITEQAEQWVDAIRHAGAIFIGPYSSEALGDYITGPNHVLPTLRTSRFSSPLGVYDFQKRSSIIQVSAQAAQTLGPIAGTLADYEGLAAHAQSARLRVDPNVDSKVREGATEAATYAFSEQVRQMHAYQVAPAEGLIKLDAMENPYTLPPELREELSNRLSNLDLNRYPVPSYTPIKDGLRSAYEIAPSAQLVVGNGSDELILMLCLAVAGASGCVLAPVPSFAMYGLSAQLAGNQFVGVPLTQDFLLDEQAMLDAVNEHQPSLVFIAYPNNPTGACFDEAAIAKIIKAAPGVVVLDEAYFPFAGKTWMDRLAQYSNLIVMRTVSKIGLAGIRIGYLAADPIIAENLEKVRPPYNISVLDEAAAVFALENISLLNEQAALVTEQRAVQVEKISALQGVEVFSSSANFLLIRVQNAQRLHAGMVKRGVLVRDVSKMHPMLNNCLRISISTPQENQALLDALTASLKD
jgi:histidinol dehydrogenase